MAIVAVSQNVFVVSKAKPWKNLDSAVQIFKKNVNQVSFTKTSLIDNNADKLPCQILCYASLKVRWNK